MSKDNFTVKYEIEDFYGLRADITQYFTIDSSCLPDDFDEEDLESFLEESVQEHLRNTITAYMPSRDIDSFISWGKQALADRKGSC